MCNKLSAKYYQDYDEKLHKKACKNRKGKIKKAKIWSRTLQKLIRR